MLKLNFQIFLISRLFPIEFLFSKVKYSGFYLFFFVHFLMHTHGTISAAPCTDSSPFINSKEYKAFTLDGADKKIFSSEKMVSTYFTHFKVANLFLPGSVVKIIHCFNLKLLIKSFEITSPQQINSIFY